MRCPISQSAAFVTDYYHRSFAEYCVCFAKDLWRDWRGGRIQVKESVKLYIKAEVSQLSRVMSQAKRQVIYLAKM